MWCLPNCLNDIKWPLKKPWIRSRVLFSRCPNTSRKQIKRKTHEQHEINISWRYVQKDHIPFYLNRHVSRWAIDQCNNTIYWRYWTRLDQFRAIFESFNKNVIGVVSVDIEHKMKIAETNKCTNKKLEQKLKTTTIERWNNKKRASKSIKDSVIQSNCTYCVATSIHTHTFDSDKIIWNIYSKFMPSNCQRAWKRSIVY